jgi:hypothetical protein
VIAGALAAFAALARLLDPSVTYATLRTARVDTSGCSRRSSPPNPTARASA